MKNWSIVLTALLMFCTQTSAEQTLLKVGYADYRPYSYSLNGKAAGIEVDVLNAVAARLNIKIHHQVLPWKRVQMMVEGGALDAYVAVKTPARSKYTVAGKQSIALGKVSFFVHKDNYKKVTSLTLQDIQQLRLGAINGSGWAKKNLNEENVHYLSSMNALTQMLVLKRIDGIAENSFILADYLKRYDLKKDIKEIELDLPSLKLVMLISKFSPFASKIEQIDAVLKDLHAEGVIQNIFDEYR
jgi:polar amino acid transport system substrate-binding protein